MNFEISFQLQSINLLNNTLKRGCNIGQYFKAVELTSMEAVESYDYNNGAKLMEHSYIGNQFMEAVETLLIPGGRWYKGRIVWAGDYADPEPDYGEETTIYSLVSHLEEGTNKMQKPQIHPDLETFRFIVNHTKKEYCSKRNLGETDRLIHSLSLITAEGNGRGGGDYSGYDLFYVGTWARDSISIEKEVPEGYVYVMFNFKE